MITKHHIAGATEDPICWVRGTITKDIIDCFIRALVGGSLLGANATKADK